MIKGKEGALDTETVRGGCDEERAQEAVGWGTEGLAGVYAAVAEPRSLGWSAAATVWVCGP